ncbi:MAG: FHA domain-containing protein [Methylococcaceae bacterium]|nr:FHA domain-containing protein [Methylococcaceae bacterium]
MGKTRGDDTTELVSAQSRVPKPAAEPVAHFVVVVDGSETGRKIELGLDVLSVGRADDNALILRDPCVSSHHCRIRFEEGRVWVEDLSSTNGSYIDEVRVAGRAEWPITASLRLGNQLMRREFRHREEARKADALGEDLRHAAHYVQTLLPAPVPRGPVKASWRFVPSAGLGGDIFDYFWLDPEHFVFYLLDVCGHGTGAALHSVSVFNLLRQRALAGVDFHQPGQVLAALNRSMPMDRYNGMYFTLWYGILRPSDQTLQYAAAGHPPALVFDHHGSLIERLDSPDPPIGVIDETSYRDIRISIPPSSLIYLYSDGLYEFTTSVGEIWTCDAFAYLLEQQLKIGQGQPELVFQQVRKLAVLEQIEDDISLLRISM